ncbi:efflux RND transporter permease subunit [Lentilitoribacter sp. Alg239-R112]|uniref:efflux RND transporter permease subunit n=1 Tax=Lentilitoribacter sp. Alg239-R112 TaxID=2305987 RepID=UPI0013A6F30F|nr:efflux RND transporter permease subunit [Lentilitoribacter sp. Alg239-R112]
MIEALQAIISRPKTVLTLMVVLVIAGVMTYINVPKEANPDIDVPVYFVTVSQQGISPRDAERLLVRPLETQLRGLDGLKEITTVSNEGLALAVLEFTIDSDKDLVLAAIRDKVDKAKAEFPAEADEPNIAETNFALEPTIIVTLSGQVPERTLTSFANRLSDEIESISTVREATLNGDRDEVLEVILDLTKLESYNITQIELINAVSSNNQLVPAGFIDDGQGRFNVKVPGLLENAQDVYSIPIKQNGEGVVTLGDVAEIRPTYKEASSYTRVNGEPAISISVVKRIGTNIIANNETVREVVNEFTKDWPQTIKVSFLIDQSSFIFEVLGSLQSSIMTAIVLVMICVVWALGIRSGLLVGLAIPGSFMVAFLIVGSLGMTVNMMVMFGMVITVGMLVDGAIVVTEYADRKITEGMEAGEAYKRSARLMFWPVVSSTATTLAAFLPLLLWPGVPGEFMSYLPRMVIIVLSASLLTALVFLPVTGTLFAKVSVLIAKFAKYIVSLLAAGLVGAGLWLSPNLNEFPVEMKAGVVAVAAIFVAVFSAFIFTLVSGRKRDEEVIDGNARMLSAEAELDIKKLTGFTGVYSRFLSMFIGNIFGNIVVLVAVIAMTVFSFSYFGANNKGVEFFVDEEPDVAIVLVSVRGNRSAAEIRDLVTEVDERILAIPGIENSVMNASAGSGGADNPIGGVQDKPADTVGEITIELADFCCRRVAADIFDDIRQQTANIAGIRVEVKKIEGGPPTGKDVRLEIKSTNYETMIATVSKVRQHFDSLELLADQEDGRPLPGIEWQLDVDRVQAGRYQTSITEVGSMVQLVTNGVMIGKYRPDNSQDEVEIRVRLPKDQRTLDQFDQIRINTPNGQVPVSNFVTREPVAKVSSIVRRDGLYAMDIKASLATGAQFDGRDATPDDAVGVIQEWLDTQEWPDSVFIKFRGADEEQKESETFLANAAMGALFMMFIILLTQFNSFYQTIITLSTVILAVSGVLIGMVLTGQKFSIIMTGTGVIALAGIVVNNAIVLIDTFNRMREDGVTDIRQAVIKTAAQRLRPILLTTGTTILGLIPMALQINFNFFTQTTSVGGITSIWWVQLSTAIISGLAYSTVLTLVMIPTLLALPNNIMGTAAWLRFDIKSIFRRKKKDTLGDDEITDQDEIDNNKGPANENNQETVREAAE